MQYKGVAENRTRIWKWRLETGKSGVYFLAVYKCR